MQREVEDVYAKNDLILSIGEINAFGLLLIIYIATVSIIVTKKQIRGEFKVRHFGFCGLRARNGVFFVNAVKDDFSSRSLFLAYRMITFAYWIAVWIYSLTLQIGNKEEYARLFPNWSDSAIMLYLAVSTFETIRQFCISKEELKQDNSSENASLMIYLSQFLFEIALLFSFINTALIQTFRYKIALLDMPFYHFHSFVSGAIIMSTELFLGSLPVRFYHFTCSILTLLIYCLIQYAMDQKDLHLFPIWDDSRFLSPSRNKLKEAILTGLFLGFIVHVFLFSLSAIKWLYWLTPTSYVKNDYRVVVKTRDIQHEKLFSNPKAKLKYISRVAGMLANADKQLESLRRQSRTSLSTKISEMTEQLRAISNSRPDTRQKAQSAENPADEYLGHVNRNFTM